jgi:hypothetical protein
MTYFKGKRKTILSTNKRKFEVDKDLFNTLRCKRHQRQKKMLKCSFENKTAISLIFTMKFLVYEESCNQFLGKEAKKLFC